VLNVRQFIVDIVDLFVSIGM